MFNPYSPVEPQTTALSDNARTESSRQRFGYRSIASFAAMLTLGFASASAINAIACPIGMHLMGDFYMHARSSMDAAGWPLFFVMNVMYSLLQLPPTVLFSAFALMLLPLKGRLVAPVFIGSMVGYALRTTLDFHNDWSGSQWLFLSIVEMGFVGLLFLHLRSRSQRYVRISTLHRAIIATYMLLFVCFAAYDILIES